MLFSWKRVNHPVAKPKPSKKRSRPRGRSLEAGGAPQAIAAPLRIVGGRFRGRKLRYSGDPRTRPMKQRVREAIFNLVGPAVRGMHAIDLFAGSGALGLEALSRGAASATFVEQHFPTCRIIEENAASLGVAGEATVLGADALVWLRQKPNLPEGPWLVFVSPPYDFYVDRAEAMGGMIEQFVEMAPEGSILVVEADERFALTNLPRAADWDVRKYPPAVVGLLRKDKV